MKEIQENNIQEFKDFISNHQYFYVIGHKEPDGDCIASCLGIADILKKSNKEYKLLSAGPFKRPEIKKFEKQFSNKTDFLDNKDREITGLIILDCSELSRLGEIDGDLSGLDIFVIDHHKTSNLPENAKGFIDPEAPACAYLVQIFYEKILGKIPLKLANILFFGLSTDTGYFRFLSQDSAEVFMAAARLVSYGVEPRMIYNEINSGKPYSTRQLLGVLLSKAERYLDGKLVITYETLEDTKKYGSEGRDSDALYQLLLSSQDVEAAVFLRQDTISTCTGGFRSVDKIDVSQVAAKFGGGGHKNASGMSTDGKIENLIPLIVKEFAKII
ncbi:MAG: bifunctional oligoribonuclease/PAP phosphatase NrnA [Spirochaetaceae bacterium]|nr:bifunctional oligoribonuclease/PAP phosphatase NrnA [Spirochaetaceae bacterium]